MKKGVAVLACAVTMAAVSAHAEHKLLITDVLDAKQVEAQAGYEYTHLWGKVGGNVSESLFSAGVGLGGGLEISAAIPYVYNESYTFGEDEAEKRDGVGDFSFGAKYRILDEKPVTVAVGLDVKFDTAGIENTGTGTTDFTPYIAVSKNIGHEMKPYAAYLATLKNNGGQDEHTIRLGIEKELSHAVTLDARVDATFLPGQGESDTYQKYTAEVGAYLELAHNFYLLPAVAYQYANLPLADGSVSGVKTAVSLYYLF